MSITGMKWGDIMVLCKPDWHIETIFDEEFYADMYIA